MSPNGASVGLLVVGYGVAVAAATRLRPAFRSRRPAAAIAFEAGTAIVIAGWLARGRWAPAMVNSVALVGFAALWRLSGRSNS